MEVSPKQLWDQSLVLISKNVTKQQFNTWFKPIVFESYNAASKTLLVQVPSPFVYEYLEQNFVDLLSKVLHQTFGQGIRLSYRVITDKEHNLSQNIEADPADGVKTTPRTRGNKSPNALDAAQPQEIDSQLNPHLNFNNYIEGDSNKLPRSIGLSIAEHPNTTQFNPFFIYGPSGCGKTHLANAIGIRVKQLFPQKRVLYVSARLFQVQYTDAVLNNHVNDFIRYYQTIDVLIVDDIQEWESAQKTQLAFFHIFNHLFKNGKRLILASDRPPVELKGIQERLLTRFSCGLIAELEKPNTALCRDILKSLIRRDGLDIPDDVVNYIAENADGSVRDLQGVIQGLLAYSITFGGDINLRLAERVIKRAVKIDDRPLTVDDIVETVCKHFHVTPANVSSKSRKRDFVVARQVSMFLAQKYTMMPASRIGKLVGNRDHSTVVHSCAQVERRLSVDAAFKEELMSIETSFKLKK